GLQPGTHGSTFGGNPLACTAALTTLDVIEQADLRQQAAEQGEFIRGALASQLTGVPGIVQIRGIGLMIGIELDRPCGEIVKQALAAGLLINVTADSVIRLLPPLIIRREEARQLVDRLADIIQRFLQTSAG
ncbi:MAG TPA: aspartate aminotransferase family protein, partial [Betaproteobacteria bacterium]|nr:aspartate aminotransferase family protein [Betaproteobacteria bacterium]